MPAQYNVVGDAVDLAASASGGNGNALTYSATGLPAGLSIDSASGEITGSIASSAYRSSAYSVTVSVSDGVTTDKVR